MPSHAYLSTQDNCLATEAETRLRANFHTIDHRPSETQWDAIRDLLAHLQKAADKLLPPAVYVSAIPAGTGKTTGLTAFAGTLMDSLAHMNIGMVIACNHLSEVEDIARSLAPYRDKLCILVGIKSAETLAPLAGQEKADTAQVVITTQAALKATLRGGQDFDGAARYHYRGQRRAVVCWDEAFAFNRHVVLNSDAIGALASLMRPQSPAAATALKKWAADLDNTPQGPCEVPDFEGLGIDFKRLEEDATDNDELAAQTKALAVITGGPAYIAQDNGGQAGAVVTHIPEIPPSLMPVIVTDASAAKGVNHEAYAQMAKVRPLVRLLEAPKTYANLKLRIVPLAASRSAFRDRKGYKGRALIDQTVAYVQTLAPERVLIVTYKRKLRIPGVGDMTIQEAIEARLTPEEQTRVAFLTWGKHTATNAYKDCRHIVLLGLPFLPSVVSYAASGAAMNLSMRTTALEDHPTKADVKAMEAGMLRDAVHQALLRGAARVGVEGDCGNMDALIFQAPQRGIPIEDYRAMFPSVAVDADKAQTAGSPLKGRLGELGALITRLLNEDRKAIPAGMLRGALNMEEKNFTKLRKRPEWMAWMAQKGLQYGPLQGRAWGITFST